MSRTARRTPSRRTIRAVTFDVGGTLIECSPSVGHLYAEVAARHGYPRLSPITLENQFHAAWRALKNFSYTTAEWASLVDATFHGLIQPPPSETFFPQLFDRFSEPDAWRVFDDVVPALEALQRKGIRLAVISNWDTRLQPLLRRLNLAAYFQAIIVSCEAGAQKPDRRIFAQACAALGTLPGETLHVGDSLEMDVRGARAAGLKARWLQRGAHGARAAIRTLEEVDKI